MSSTIFLRTSWNELRITFDGLLAQFGMGGGGMGEAIKRFTDWLGTGVVGVFGIAVKAVERLVAAFSTLVTFFKALGSTVKQAFSGDILSGEDFAKSFGKNFARFDAQRIAGENATRRKIAEEQRQEAFIKSNREYEEIARKRIEEQRKKNELTNKKARPPVKVQVNNYNDIRAEADPDQIALSLEKITASSIERPLSAVDVEGT